MTTKPISIAKDEENRRVQLKRWIDEHFNGVQMAFIKAHKLNQGEISALLRGGRTFGEIKARTIESQAKMPEKYLDIPADKDLVIGGYQDNEDDSVNIHEFNVKAAMGNGLILPEQPGIIKMWKVTKDWARLNIPSNTGLHNLCIVTGFDDSMRPMFNSGDPLIVDTGLKEIELDATYFFRVENEGFIKRIQRVPGVGKVVISENKNYKEWILRDDMDYEVFGRVLKVWKSDDI